MNSTQKIVFKRKIQYKQKRSFVIDLKDAEKESEHLLTEEYSTNKSNRSEQNLNIVSEIQNNDLLSPIVTEKNPLELSNILNAHRKSFYNRNQ